MGEVCDLFAEFAHASPVVASTVTVLAVPSLVFSLASVMVASLMLVGSSFAADQFDGSF